MGLVYKLISALILVAVGIFAVALAIVNTEPVAFNFYIQNIQISLSLLLVYAFTAGVIVAFLVVLPTIIHLKLALRKNRKLRQQVNSAQLQLGKL